MQVIAALRKHSHTTIARRQGQLACEVDKRPAPAEAAAPRRIKSYRISSGGIEVVMANVACRLYANPANKASRKQLLLAAFSGLRAAVPQSS
jgi:hypothetical protein